jgi:hypothetical protein
MNSLRYTNALLTIIALALSAIAVEKFIRPTVAPSAEIQLVAICGVPSHVCLDVERAQGNALDVHVIR